MWVNAAFGVIPGGHQVQMGETAAALRRRGHEVVVASDAASIDLDAGFDVVHGLGLEPGQVRAARLAGLPVVMSTIWWSRDYREGRNMPWTLERAKGQALRAAVAVKRVVDGRREVTWFDKAAMAFEGSMVLLPNGPGEAKSIRADTGASTAMMTVPNGIDPARFCPTDQRREDFVLIAGRVEPHKNQLGVIRALRGSGREIVVAGAMHPDHEDYYRKCAAELEGQGEMLGPVAHEKLPDLYRRAGVHVLATWFETTGLASLEAAACGAPIVSTSRGFARDYFGDLAVYCDPARPASIVDAVEAAAGRPQPGLAELVRSQYTWDRAAERTERAYEVATLRRPWSDLTEELLD
jgi:glycosyltransferase involved in cell wall biosynthesis